MPGRTQLKKDFDTGDFRIGASWIRQFFWYFTDVAFFRSKLVPFSSVLAGLLRLYGANIGKEVRIKPGIHVKYPWKLTVGDNSWLADCYIENLAPVNIGAHCCISQKAVLMTGNHNYKSSSFDLITAPITLEDGVWIGAGAMVAPGVTAFTHAILGLGSVATGNLDAYTVYHGVPAKRVRNRIIE